MKESFPNANITLCQSSGGDFRVVVDGETIYDKLDTLLFPKIFEVTKLIQAREAK